MNVTAILQGRVGSTRLPGKVLLPLAGKPVILHVYERIKRCTNIDQIIVATSTRNRDNDIARLFADLDVTVFRGSEEDPLDRFFDVATRCNLQHIVRIMADCLVVDPDVVDEVISFFSEGDYDFCYLGGEFPTGLDVTVFSYDTLKKAWNNSEDPSERQHIVSYMLKHSDLFRIGCVEIFEGLYHHRWVLDHEADYRLMTEIYDELYEPDRLFVTEDILHLLEQRPEMIQYNAHIPRTII